MKSGKKCFPLFVFSCVCVVCVLVRVCMSMPCLCKCLDLHLLFYMSVHVYICTWVIMCMQVCVHSAYSLCSLPNIKEVSVPWYTHAFSPSPSLLSSRSLCAVPFIVMTTNAPTISEEQSCYRILHMYMWMCVCVCVYPYVCFCDATTHTHTRTHACAHTHLASFATVYALPLLV